MTQKGGDSKGRDDSWEYHSNVGTIPCVQHTREWPTILMVGCAGVTNGVLQIIPPERWGTRSLLLRRKPHPGRVGHQMEEWVPASAGTTG